jgi:hypothetical protein
MSPTLLFCEIMLFTVYFYTCSISNAVSTVFFCKKYRFRLRKEHLFFLHIYLRCQIQSKMFILIILAMKYCCFKKFYSADLTGLSKLFSMGAYVHNMYYVSDTIAVGFACAFTGYLFLLLCCVKYNYIKPQC